MSEEREVKGSKGPLVVGLYLISMLVALYFMVPDFHDFINESYRILTSGDDARIQKWVEEIGIWGPAIIIGGMTAQMFLVVIPSWMLMLVSILAYGPLWGVLLILVSNDAISFVGGLLKMGYWKFIGATMAGILPLSLLFAYFGEDTDRMKGGLIAVSIVSLIGFIGYVYYDRKRRAGAEPA